ncbi:hypothetical protein K7X08_019242 [Anisodus acutangulus]|uniref:HMA domain-containing protein n=1 Tax=Anisodus acutangulus TaxID=402998 RepID=A0A9Q1MS57_9SOLA|nr:hypothetical protein K7X08_019242 [Anisodus acutangulus]
MASMSAFSVCSANVFPIGFQSKRSIYCYSYPPSLVKAKVGLRSSRIFSAIEEDASTAVAEQTTTDQTVSISVSPSDVLTMFFQAEGTMNEAAIPNVTNALEDVGGITGLKVQVVEGIASVELTKQTTIQATGVASSLVETIQGSGFKLQTLNLSFQDEDSEA